MDSNVLHRRTARGGFPLPPEREASTGNEAVPEIIGIGVAVLLTIVIALVPLQPSPADGPPASPVANARGAGHPGSPEPDDFSPYVTKDGGISLPVDYREKFLHLGTWAVATKLGKPVDEMHNVYARLEDIQAYRRDGKFPDGAVLVKDITRVGSDKLTTGQATWATDIKIWFVMIKDAKGRFPKNDVWGDGWGWALYEAKDPKKNVATDYKTDCKVCHIPAKKDDWVYIRGYPVLAKPTPPK
jgi:Cytochrome P460